MSLPTKSTESGRMNATTRADSVIELEDLSFVRGGEVILADVSWRMRSNEHWVMIGPNGSGKSTVAACVSGYDWPTTGRVSVLGARYGTVDLSRHRARLGIFQPARQSGLPLYHASATALDVILTGLDGSLALYTEPTAADMARARDLFARYFSGPRGFPLERRFAALSSGEQRRVLLLRLFMGRPELLLLDEPYESLDIPARQNLAAIVADYVQQQNVPSWLILHRVEEIPAFVTHAILIKAGRVFAAGPITETLSSEKLSELFEIPLKLGRESEQYYCVPAEPLREFSEKRSGGDA